MVEVYSNNKVRDSGLGCHGIENCIRREFSFHNMVVCGGQAMPLMGDS